MAAPVGKPLDISPLAALRRDPTHVAEINALYAMGALVRRYQPSRRDAGRPPEERARRIVHRATMKARRAGAATGTSFVIGIPAALATIYLGQLRMVLDVAAAFGRDPTDPIRAAEFLVLQGRHPTVAEAADTLARVPYPKGPRQGLMEAVRSLMGQIPSLISVQWEKFRASGVINAVITVLGLASFVVPFLGVPVCAAGSARTARRLGRAAIDYYRSAPTDAVLRQPLRLPRPPGRGRMVVRAIIGFLILAVGAGATVAWIGAQHHGVKRILLGLVWLWIGSAYVRLFVLLNPPAGYEVQPSP